MVSSTAGTAILSSAENVGLSVFIFCQAREVQLPLDLHSFSVHNFRDALRNSISHMELNMHIHLPDDSDTESEATEGEEAAISND